MAVSVRVKAEGTNWYEEHDYPQATDFRVDETTRSLIVYIDNVMVDGRVDEMWVALYPEGGYLLARLTTVPDFETLEQYNKRMEEGEEPGE